MTSTTAALDFVDQSKSVPARYPWFKLFPADWVGDERLTMCTIGARGLLLEFICIMHRATPYGHLLVNSKTPTDAELVRLARMGSVGEMRRLRGELLEHGVLSITADGVLYSRRMVRKALQSAIGHVTGKRGGNPALRPVTETVNGEPLDAPLTVPDNTQRLDARCQSTPQPPKGGGAAVDAVVVAEFDRFWQAWPAPRKNRKKALERWRRIRPLPDRAFTDRVIASVEHHKQSRDWQKDGGQYIPLPTTWLNGERWNDDVMPPEPTALTSGRAVADVDETAKLLAEYRQAGGRS